MTRVVVVGSGASAVHFAQSLLEKGQGVLMLDVGRQQPPLSRPDDSLAQLKRSLSDPVGYFLGDRFQSVVYPDQAGEYYGFPPSKDYVFAGVDQFQLESQGFSPLASFARGGLAEAWTAGAYPLNEAELEDFPVSLDEMAPYYDLVARRIGISGEADDLARFMPVHDHLMAPLDLDEHSQNLLCRIAGDRSSGSVRNREHLEQSRFFQWAHFNEDQRS